MTSSSEPSSSLVIQENQTFSINEFQIKVLSYLGQLSADIHYFKVNILIDIDADNSPSKLGLLRVGSTEGGLHRELELRKILGDYKMIAELITHTIKDSVIINPASPVHNTEIPENPQNERETATEENEIEPKSNSVNGIEDENTSESNQALEVIAEPGENTSNQVEQDWDYLEEEYYPEINYFSDDSTSKLINISTGAI